MKLLALTIAGGITLCAVAILGHLAFIEIGREVVTLRTPLPDGASKNGGWKETRLWVVDHDGGTWLHSAGDGWRTRFQGDPIVELERAGQTLRYRAHLVPGPHAEIDRLLREKYGTADRWVRFLAPCDEGVVPVRLDLLPMDGGVLADPTRKSRSAQTDKEQQE